MRRLGTAQHAQGQDASAHQADCRYSHVRQTHKNRLSTLLVRVYYVLFVCSEATRGRTGMGTHIRYRTSYASVYRGRAAGVAAPAEVEVEAPSPRSTLSSPRPVEPSPHNRTAPR